VNADAVCGQVSDQTELGFWGHRLPQDLGGAAQDQVLGLELTNASAGGHQLGSLLGRQARDRAGVDQLLAAPRVENGLGDLQV
jgi:hypothetical protein